jgi:hypothetical protein
MKVLSNIEISKIKTQTSQKYKTVEEFAAAKLKEASESIKNVDLSLLRK